MKESESFKLFLRGRWFSVSHFLYISLIAFISIIILTFLLPYRLTVVEQTVAVIGKSIGTAVESLLEEQLSLQ